MIAVNCHHYVPHWKIYPFVFCVGYASSYSLDGLCFTSFSQLSLIGKFNRLFNSNDFFVKDPAFHVSRQWNHYHPHLVNHWFRSGYSCPSWRDIRIKNLQALYPHLWKNESLRSHYLVHTCLAYYIATNTNLRDDA
jgi:hypothetical protein